MALVLTYTETRRLIRACEREIRLLEMHIEKMKKALATGSSEVFGGGAARKRGLNRQKIEDHLGDYEDKMSSMAMVMQKLQEEKRRLEGQEVARLHGKPIGAA